jgi:hypothetical protein
MKFRVPAVVFLCGWFGTVAPASSLNWQPTGAPNNRWSSPACSADGTKVVAVVGNQLLASTNSGFDWFTNGAPGTNWTCVASSADGVKLVASAALIYSPVRGGAHGGPIYTSTDSGATWSLTSAPSNQWSCVASSADGCKLVACAAYNSSNTYSNTVWGSIYVSTNSGSDWTVTSAPTNIWNCVASSADGTRLVAACGGIFPANAGGIFISTDSGATWTSNSISADFPAGDSPDWICVASSADGATLMGMRGLRFYNASNVPRVYASTNFGDTWTSKDLPTGSSGFVAVSADGSRLLASKDYFYISTNGGATWMQNNIQGQQFGWGSACVASSADGNKLFLAVGADGFGQPGTIYTSYTPPRPQLYLTPSENNLTLSWLIPSTNFVVQQTPDLSAGNWVTLTGAPQFNPTNLQNQISLSTSNSSGFFRLTTQ